MASYREIESAALQRGTDTEGRPLGVEEREKMIKKYLPSPSESPADTAPSSPVGTFSLRLGRQRSPRKTIREAASQQLYILLYTFVHSVFSLYLLLRRTYHVLLYRILTIRYYHYRTPGYIEKDLRTLDKLPQHLSVIVKLEEADRSGASALFNNVGEISAWTAAAGIPMLSVYEKTGVLKRNLSRTYSHIQATLKDYYGDNAPILTMVAPNSAPVTAHLSHDLNNAPALTVLLLSAEDGRNILVDLTRTLAAMAQRDKLLPDDISAELIDAELSESVMREPDLLVIFGPRVELQGYPPWQLRLTEIFHAPDNTTVSYHVLLRALYRYAKAQMRFGS